MLKVIWLPVSLSSKCYKNKYRISTDSSKVAFWKKKMRNSDMKEVLKKGMLEEGWNCLMPIFTYVMLPAMC
jgi:hypothetical protein